VQYSPAGRTIAAGVAGAVGAALGIFGHHIYCRLKNVPPESAARQRNKALGLGVFVAFLVKAWLESTAGTP